MKQLIVAMIALFVCAAGFIACERADMYNAATEIPVQPAVVLFNASQHTGNLGGLAGADSICRMSLQANNLTFKDITRAKAFISTGEYDAIRNTLPVEYWYLPVYGIGSSSSMVFISDSWNNLWDGSIDATLGAALGLSTTWWSGSTADGGCDTTAICEGWSTDSATPVGRSGDFAVTTASWLYYATPTCNNSYYLLCVGY